MSERLEAGKSQAVPLPVQKIVDGIYQLESSSGKNDDKCERLGLHNGFGYSQGIGRNFCLNSDEEMRKLVENWVIEKQKDHSLRAVLCIYNQGIDTESCEYADKFQSL